MLITVNNFDIDAARSIYFDFKKVYKHNYAFLMTAQKMGYPLGEFSALWKAKKRELKKIVKPRSEYTYY